MLFYMVRAEAAVNMIEILERLKQIAAGAAMMAQTTALEPKREFIYANVLPNKTLLNIVSSNIKKHFRISLCCQRTRTCQSISESRNIAESCISRC